MTAEQHNKTIAILSIVLGVMQLIGALFLAILILAMGGLGIVAFNDPKAGAEVAGFLGFASLIYGIAFLVCLAIGIISVISGWKHLKMKPKSRTWGIIAVVGLWFVPFGFIISIYYIIVFLAMKEGRDFLQRNGMG